VEVPLLGIHLNFRFGTSHIRMIAVSEVIGASLAASLLGWLLPTILDRRTPHARPVWTSMALVALAASLALPLAAASTAATTTSAVVGLVVMHLAIGAAVIPAMARTRAGTRRAGRVPPAGGCRRRCRPRPGR
jgi:hypothetical protein